jgi:hypothetical protein
VIMIELRDKRSKSLSMSLKLVVLLKGYCRKSVSCSGDCFLNREKKLNLKFELLLRGWAENNISPFYSLCISTHSFVRSEFTSISISVASLLKNGYANIYTPLYDCSSPNGNENIFLF